MPVPTNFQTAIASGHAYILRWIEIEGIPYAYGTQAVALFGGRPAAEQFLGMRAQLVAVPDNADQELNPLDGIASRMGQVDFTIGDMDGQPTLWTSNAETTDWVRLRRDTLAAELVFDVDRTIPAAFVVGGYVYVGPETALITAIDNTTKRITVSYRGAFRSTGRDLGRGFPLAPVPYVIGKRRVWYFQCAITSGEWIDADKVTRFVGTVEDYKLARDGGAYVMSVQSLEKAFSKDVFTDMRTLRDSARAGITGLLGEEPGLRPRGWPGWTEGAINGASEVWQVPDASKVLESEEFFVRVDDEIIQCARGNGAGASYIYIGGRGCFGTTIEAHAPGFTAKEIIGMTRWIDPATGDTNHEHRISHFGSVPTSKSPLPADHPLILILQVLLSTGRGINVGIGARNYDVLPENYGLGVPVWRVDTAGIEAAAAERPGLRGCGVLESATNFIDFVRDMLKPLGYYALVTVGDLWTIRSFRLPNPDEGFRAIGNSDIIAGSRPTWDANVQGTVKSVEYKSGWDIVEGTWRQVDLIRLGDANIFSGGEGQQLSFECKYLYPAGVRAAGCAPKGAMDVRSIMEIRADFFAARYGRSPAKVGLSLAYKNISLEPGDNVLLTAASLPKPSGLGRGMVDVPGVVLSKRIDDRNKTISVDLLMTASVRDYRLFAPSARLVNVIDLEDGTFWITCTRNEFTEASVRGSTQTDIEILRADGTYWRWLELGLLNNFLYCWRPTMDFPILLPRILAGTINYASVNFLLDVSAGTFLDYQSATDTIITLPPYTDFLTRGVTPHPGEVVAFFSTPSGAPFSDGSSAHDYYP